MTTTPLERMKVLTVINGENRLFADLELSAIASAGFRKEHSPEDIVQIRNRGDGTLRTVLG